MRQLLDNNSGWFFIDLPFKCWSLGVDHPDYKELERDWGPLSPILPVPAMLSYEGLTFNNSAYLYRNILPIEEVDIYLSQQYREYYLVWKEDSLMNEFVQVQENQRTWVTESYRMMDRMHGQALLVEDPKNPQRGIGAVPLSGIYLGNGCPRDMNIYNEFLKPEYVKLQN